MTLTVEEVAEADPEESGLGLDIANSGEYVMAIEDGRFAVTLENEYLCTWAYGTLVLNGDRLEMSFIDGDGPAANKPGEAFVYTWSLYRDSLTLGSVPGGLSPSNFRVKPWERLGSTPSALSFSTRCPLPAGALRDGTHPADR